jgi:hypothetical protein
MEGGITGWQRFGSRRPVDADRRERAVIAHADTARVQEHAGEITGVVGMQAGEEHRFQTGESPVPRQRRRTATRDLVLVNKQTDGYA